jgi:hypothetical protein
MISQIKYHFSVKGSGRFPYKLLSLCCAYPQGELDAYNIFEEKTRVRTINLVGNMPSANFWASNGWSVVKSPPVMVDDYNEYHTWPC